MAPLKVLINGFGRIGRLTFRYLYEDPLFEIKGINDLCSCDSAAYLGNYDSIHGRWSHRMVANDDTITVDGTHEIAFSQSKTIEGILNVGSYDVVLECTGKHLKVAGLEKYFEMGVKRVIVSAPVKENGAVNIVLGCNHELIGDNKLVTNASCTTNCIGPVIKVIKENLGIKHGCITTVHNVTGTQVRYVCCVLCVVCCVLCVVFCCLCVFLLCSHFFTFFSLSTSTSPNQQPQFNSLNLADPSRHAKHKEV